jgi:predicted dehydrogenase
MTQNRIRVAVAGAGMVTRHHLIAWSRASQVDVVAIQNRTPGKAQRLAAEFGIPKVYGGLEEMLEKENPDALDIAVSMELHATYARTAAEYGIAILCQKPMTPTLAESEALVADIGQKVRFMVHENWRFRPQYRQAAAWIAQGRTGPIHQFSLSALSSGLLSRNAEGVPAALARQPFMARLQRFIIMELLIHHLDTIRYLIGPLVVLGCRTQRLSAEVVGEDMALILLKTAAGALGTISGNFSAAGFPPLSQDRLELIGQQRSILFENNQLRLLGDKEETMSFDMTDAYQKSYDVAIAHFVECLRSGQPFETDCADNLATLRLVEEAYRQAEL